MIVHKKNGFQKKENKNGSECRSNI